MLEGYTEFKQRFIEKNFVGMNKAFLHSLQKINILQINNNDDISCKIGVKIKQADFIVIDRIEEKNQSILILCFDEQLFIIEQPNKIDFKKLFEFSISKDNVFLANNVDDNFLGISANHILYLGEFKKNFHLFDDKYRRCNSNDLSIKFWDKIKLSISGYLLQKSFFKCKIDRIQNFFSNVENYVDIEEKTFQINEFIKLTWDTGSNTHVGICYHIPSERLVAIKERFGSDYLSTREISNYRSVNFPLLARFYGTLKKGKKECIVFEYIHGSTLANIRKLNLNIRQKIKIIFEILFIFGYLHKRQFIYRDLKPNNAILDENKRIILIDFDRMIKEKNDGNITRDLGDIYAAPEIEIKPVLKSDIFSLGKIFYFILFEEEPFESQINELTKSHPMLYSIYKKCTENDAEKRFSIQELIKRFKEYFITSPLELHEFPEIIDETIIQDIQSDITDCEKIDQIISKFSFDPSEKNSNIQNDIAKYYFFNSHNYKKAIHFLKLEADRNNPEAINELGIIYIEGVYTKKNVDEALQYFNKAINLNYPKAFFNLGYFLLYGKYIRQDINKAIQYLTYASDHNISEAQFYLAMTYFEGELVPQDIQKGFHYLTLAANLNNSRAQNNLGFLYYEGKYVQRDVNKAIHYFTLASNSKDSGAIYNIGSIYYEGKYIQRDIDKAIHYFKLASDLNNSNALYKLGVIYYEGKYIQRDIDKAISYFTLASKFNNPNAQYYLGVIYYEGKYIQRDIDKAINYFKLASDLNNPNALYKLGVIYYEGKYIQRDINKAINYYMLASNNNHPYALNSIGNIYFEGKYLQKDIKKAVHYYSLAANLNCRPALFNLGVIYLNDNSNSQNIKNAINYLKLASDNNFLEAQYKLGSIYYEGTFVERDINKAIHYFLLASKHNDPRSLNTLGLIYYDGKYIDRDMNKAISYFTQAAKLNFPSAQYNLGFIYYQGYYVEKDEQKAIYYFTLASNQNEVLSQNNLGLIFCNIDIEKAIYYFSLAADQNFPESQFQLGMIYLKKENIDQAINYLYKASKQNHRRALFQLGMIYYDQKQIDKAIEFFTLSSNLNYPDAQNYIGLINIEGKYLPRDSRKAIHYFSLAAAQNHLKAIYNLGIVYSETKYNVFNITKGIHYLTLAANQNNPEAALILGFIYYEGKSVKRDITKAIEFFTLAADNNCIEAFYNLGNIFYHGTFITPNINKSIHYFTLASNKNDPDAQYYLAIIYMEGEYVRKDMKKALLYLNLAAKQRNRMAQMYLADFYMEGKYVKQNIGMAIYLYIESLLADNSQANNNLGVIYYFHNENTKIRKNPIEYFEKAIKKDSYPLSYYNLELVYLNEEEEPFQNFAEVIELLFKSYLQGFTYSQYLLFFLFIKKTGSNKFEVIRDEFNKYVNIFKKCIEKFNDNKKFQYNDIDSFIFNKYRELNILSYDMNYINISYLKLKSEGLLEILGRVVSLNEINREKENQNLRILKKLPNNINKLFYEGFGFELL